VRTRPTNVEEPVVEDSVPTTRVLTFNHARRVNGRLSLPGIGNEEADVMIIAISPQEEELTQAEKLYSGQSFKFPAQLLKGPSGSLLKELCSRSGFDIKSCWYTTLVKWFPEKGRTKPTKGEIQFWETVLEHEIEKVKPKIIVCLGKPVFDFLYHRKLAYKDLNGGWFWSEKYQARLYPCDEVGALVFRPELYGRFAVDFSEIGRMVNQLRGVEVTEVPMHYSVIRNSLELRQLVEYWRQNQFVLLSVDCEWGGNTFVDGALRSIQFCWAPGMATYVRFMDDAGNYVFDVDYLVAGQIIGDWADRPEVRYLGHHIAADFPWMKAVLGLDVDGKALLDTEFALQCCDEHADLGLDRIGMAYSTLGRWDVELMLWLKDNPQEDGAGYGFIPDSILIPYAMKDVDAVFRAFPHILAFLERENVAHYYFSIFHPFVTDVFTDFAVNGLPMDRDRMDTLRDVFHKTRKLMEDQLSSDIFGEARTLVWSRMAGCEGRAEDLFLAMESALLEDGNLEAAFSFFKEAVGFENLHKEKVFFDHYVEAKSFSIRKVEMMRRWLFDVKGFTPIKSTNKKEQGLPSMAWEKVMELPAEKRVLFSPSVDKQTLEILGETHDDDLLRSLLLLNAVGNLCKAFLKEAEVDEDGEVIKEEGLHYFLASDDRVHGQMSTTETGRPRAWKPNCLNWPGYTHKKVARGVRGALSRALNEGKILPDDPALVWMDKDIPSIRSCVKAPAGWMMVESDFKTAELRSLAFSSGDELFIDMMTKPDERFGVVMHKGKELPVRLHWSESDPPYTQGVSNDWFLACAEDGKIRHRFTDADLLRDASGNLVHPPTDLHWDLAERVQKKPRETLIADIHRGAGKTGNFCIAEGEPVLTHKGWKPIECVSACDMVWDGLGWVHHAGVVFSGEKEVIHYQGLWATEAHEVWTEERGKVRLCEAVAHSLELRRPGYQGFPVVCGWFGSVSRYDREAWAWVFLSEDGVSTLRGGALEGAAEYGAGALLQVSVSGGGQGDLQMADSAAGGYSLAGDSISGYEAALRERHACVVSQLQGPGDQVSVCEQECVCGVGAESVSRGGFQTEGLRSYRQRRALRTREYALGVAVGKSSESPGDSKGAHRPCESLAAAVSSDFVHGANCAQASEAGLVRRGDTQSLFNRATRRVAKTYDILNAGPLNRFTCSGVLVSNSTTYGASATSLDRKIEQDTGVKPEPGTGDKIMEALAVSRPVATLYLKALERAPINPGFLVAASGRKRRFTLHPSHVSGISDRLRKGRASSQGREARNFPMQSSVADTAARAGVWLRLRYKQLGLRAYVMVILYDSVVTLCPPEERDIVARLHQLYMCDRNQWSFHGRVMNYPIDTGFVSRWSVKNQDKEDISEQVWVDTPAWSVDQFLPVEDR